MTAFTLSWNGHRLDLGDKPRVMAILNITPDSFSDGGRFFDAGRALAQAQKLVAEGADILDIGGESTRPFSDPVSETEELRRVIPIIQALAPHIQIPISIDTTKSVVAQQALDAGAAIINDISAMRTDPQIGAVAARAGVPIILMHMLGTPKDMQVDPHYQDLMGEIRQFLQLVIWQGEAYGIDPGMIIIDPGIGFGKTFADNFQILKQLNLLTPLNRPLLVGPSRKAFIRNTLSSSDGNEFKADHPLVEFGTQAAVAAAVLNGAHIVRVHRVAETVATLKILNAIEHCKPHESKS